MVPILSWVLTVTFCYGSNTWAVCIIIGVFHLDIYFICWLRVIRVLFCVFWSLHSWQSWWSRKQEVRKYWNGWSTDIRGGLFSILLRSSYFTDEAFSLVKSHPSILGTTPLKCQIIRIPSLLDTGLKEFCCICYFSLLAFIKCVCDCSNMLTPYQIKRMNH